jgi:hypothetical protein
MGSAALPLLQRETLTNTTIQFPEGTRYITKEHLLCVPSTWKTIVPFFLANYLAHVATVVFIPGETTVSMITTMLFALAFPSAGLSRGLDAMRQFAIKGETPLEIACRAGALCTVSRSRFSKHLDSFGNRRAPSTRISKALESDETVSPAVHVGVAMSNLEAHGADISGLGQVPDNKLNREEIAEPADGQGAEPDLDEQSYEVIFELYDQGSTFCPQRNDMHGPDAVSTGGLIYLMATS